MGAGENSRLYLLTYSTPPSWVETSSLSPLCATAGTHGASTRRKLIFSPVTISLSPSPLLDRAYSFLFFGTMYAQTPFTVGWARRWEPGIRNSERDCLWRGSCVVDFLPDSIIVSFFLHAFIDTLQHLLSSIYIEIPAAYIMRYYFFS